MKLYGSFAEAIKATKFELYQHSEVVAPATWQSVDVTAKPEMATHEVTWWGFKVDVDRYNHGLMVDSLQRDIDPNLPWCDEHFEKDRICGKPVNPGVTWQNWPWGHSANSFRGYHGGDVRSPSDWAYLAGIIDGEGSFSNINRHDNGIIHPRIKVTQVDEAFIKEMYGVFNVGTLRPYSSPSNKLSDRQSWIWRISSREEVRWVLTNTIPYLRLKKQKAIDALALLQTKDGRSNKEEFGQLFDPKFNHSYAERYWTASFEGKKIRGIRYEYGDLGDVVKQLVKDPATRQAVLPVFFPEDTGAVHGERVPCSIHYQFMVRRGRLDIFYYLRSCDFVRHFRDDVYLTLRLQLWVIDELKKNGIDVSPGKFLMQIGSLHIFRNDFRALFGEDYKPR